MHGIVDVRGHDLDLRGGRECEQEEEEEVEKTLIRENKREKERMGGEG